MSAAQEVDVFPFAGSSYRAPDPRFARYRDEQPVVQVPTEGGVPVWLITRYEDCKALSADPRISRAAACGEGAPRVGGTMHTTPEMIISLDHPEHSRLRKLVAGAFTLRRVEQMRGHIQEVVDEMLDDMMKKEPPLDLVQQLCLPLPLVVIGDLLGVPGKDLHSFEQNARAFATVDERAGSDESLAALGKLAEYIMGLIAQKRANPGDDMLSELISARDNDDRLSEQELVTFGFTLIGAGFDTTACQLANSVLAMIEHHRPQWNWLAEDPSRIPAAVEEMLRHVNLFATDTTGFPRVAIDDIEVGGVTIKKGDAVLIALSSANRDPRIFPDADVLDVARSPNPHLSFGHGLHYCLGKHLARLELELAFEGLIRRFPNLRLAVPESELPWYHGEINNMLKALPVEW